MGIPAHHLYTNNDSHLFIQPLAYLAYINKSNGQLAKIKSALFPFFFPQGFLTRANIVLWVEYEI